MTTKCPECGGNPEVDDLYERLEAAERENTALKGVRDVLARERDEAREALLIAGKDIANGNLNAAYRTIDSALAKTRAALQPQGGEACEACGGTGSDVGRYPIQGCRACDGDGRKPAPPARAEAAKPCGYLCDMHTGRCDNCDPPGAKADKPQVCPMCGQPCRFVGINEDAPDPALYCYRVDGSGAFVSCRNSMKVRRGDPFPVWDSVDMSDGPDDTSEE